MKPLLLANLTCFILFIIFLLKRIKRKTPNIIFGDGFNNIALLRFIEDYVIGFLWFG